MPRIIIVEDEVAGVGHSGEKAIAMAKELRPDLILMDIAGGRITVPAKAIFNVEHEREGNSEEVEFQFKWDLD